MKTLILGLLVYLATPSFANHSDDEDHGTSDSLESGYMINVSTQNTSVKSGDKVTFTGQVSWGSLGSFNWGDFFEIISKRKVDPSQIHAFFPDYLHEVTSSINLNSKNLKFSYTTPAVKSSDQNLFIIQIGDSPKDVKKLQETQSKLNQKAELLQALVSQAKQKHLSKNDIGYLNALIALLQNTSAKISWFLTTNNKILALRQYAMQVDNIPSGPSVIQATYGGFVFNLRANPGAPIEGQNVTIDSKVTNIRSSLTDCDWGLFDHNNSSWVLNYYWKNSKVGSNAFNSSQRLEQTFTYPVSKIQSDPLDNFTVSLDYKTHFWGDSLGSLTLNVPVTNDTVAPVWTNVQPDTNHPYVQNMQAVKGTLSDAFGTIDTNSIKATLSGPSNKDLTSSLTFTTLDEGASYQIHADAVDLPEGQYTLSLKGADNAGNKATQYPYTVHFQIDKTPPQITLGLQDGILTNNSLLHLPVTVVDATPTTTTVVLNGVALPSTLDVSFTQDLTLAEGINTIEVDSQDAAGNLNSLKLSNIILDDKPPVLSQLNPANGSVLTSSNFPISGQSNKPLSRISVNGNALTLSSDKLSFTGSYAASVFGSLVLHFDAIDTIGNESKIDVPVSIASTPLIASLISIIPAQDGKLNIVGAPGASIPGIKVSANATFFNSASVTSNSNGSFQITLSVFQNVTVTATNPASGEKSTVILSFGSAPTLLSGSVKDIDGNALPGATVTILNSNVPPVLTDSNGVFAFTQLVTGNQKIQIDGSTVTLPSSSEVPRKFSKSVISVSIGLSQSNVLQRPIYLVGTPMDGTAQTIASSNGGTVSSAQAPGVSLNIPAQTAIFPNNSSSAPITMVTIPTSVATIPPLGFSNPGHLIALEPSGTKFTSPVPLTAPNDSHLPEGTSVAVMSMNSSTGKWEIDGIGAVDPGGSTISTLPGKGITHFSSIYFSPTFTTPQEIKGNGNYSGATLDKAIEMPSFKILGQNYTPKLIYNSSWAKPSIFVSNLFDLSSTVVRLDVAPTNGVQDDDLFYSSTAMGSSKLQPRLITAQFSSENLLSPEMSFAGTPLMPLRSVVSYMMDLKDPSTQQYFSSGIHKYTAKYNLYLDEITVGTRRTSYYYYGLSPLAPNIIESDFYLDQQIAQVFPNDLNGTIAVNNETQSSAGRGWRIGGVQKIANTSANPIMIEEGDGTHSTFDLNNFSSYVFYAVGPLPVGPIQGCANAPNILNPLQLSVFDISQFPKIVVPRVRSIPHYPDGNICFDTYTYTTQIVRHDLTKGPYSNPITFVDDITNLSGNNPLVPVAPFHYSLSIGGMVTLPSGIYFTSIANHTIYRVDNVSDINNNPLGHSVVTGNIGAGFNGDGNALSNTQLNSPQMIIAGPSANTLVFSDYGNNRVRMIDLTLGTVTTLAGNGQYYDTDLGDGGPAAQASLSHPLGIAYDIFGNLFIATENGIIRKVDTLGVISTIAGNISGTLSDSTPAAQAKFKSPHGLAVDNRLGYLYVSDTGQNRVVRIDFQTMTATKVLGTSQAGLGTDGQTPTNTSISAPMMIAVDPNGNLLVADSINGAIVQVDISNSNTGTLFFTSTTDTNPGPRQNTNGSWTVPYLERLNYGQWQRNYRNGDQVVFDSSGREISSSDRVGNTTTYSYDSAGNLISIDAPLGQSISYFYSGGSLTSMRDPAGRVTRFFYDSNHNLTHVTYPDNSTRTFMYDQNGLMLSDTNQNGLPTTYTYNPYDRLSSVTLANGAVYQISDAASLSAVNNSVNGVVGQATAFDLSVGNAVNQFTDPQGHITYVTNNYYGFYDNIIDPLGNSTSTITDRQGKISFIFYPDQSAFNISYNSWNDRTFIKNRDTGEAISNTFDNYGSLLSSRDAGGKTYSYTYDSATGLLLTQTDPLGHTTAYTYNTVGLPVSNTDFAGRTMSFGYNSSGLKISMTDHMNRVSRRTYDNAGNIITATDANGKVTQFQYDAWNRLVSVTTPKNETTTYTYSPAGELLIVQDSQGNKTTYAYDKVGNVTAKTDPLGNSTLRTYNNMSQLISETDPNGNQKTYSYDVLGNMIQKVSPDNTYSFTYDFRKKVTSAQDNFSMIQIAYDGYGRIVSTKSQGRGVTSSLPSLTLGYTYDGSGNRSTMTDGFGTTFYNYDDLKRLTLVKNPMNETFLYSYNDANLTVSLSRPGSNTTFGFDANQNLTAMTHSSGSNVLEAFSIMRDAVGNITQISSTGFVNPSNRTLAYDNDYQVTSATNSEASSTSMQNETFTYDGTYNRTSDSQGSYNYDNKSQRLTDDYRYNYFYDNNGNLIKKVSKASLEDLVNLTYNSSNQLTKIETFSSGTTGAVKTVSYFYDVFGRRIQKIVNNTSAPSDVSKTFTRRYSYDGPQMLYEYDGSNTVLARYTTSDQVDDHLSVLVTSAGVTAKVAQSAGSYMYLKDQNGSIVDVTDSSGHRIQHYIYSAFGMLLGIQDANAADISSNPALNTSYGYSGRELDSESGFMYYRARYYDPSIGRFLQEDPLPGDLRVPASSVNSYIYTGNSPFNFSDPNGMSFLGDLFTGIAIGVAAIATGGAAGVALGALLGGGALGAVGGALAGALAGAAVGGIIGGVSSVIQGKSFGEGFAKGALQGALSGLVAGGMAGFNAGVSVGAQSGSTDNLLAANDPDLPISNLNADPNFDEYFRVHGIMPKYFGPSASPTPTPIRLRWQGVSSGPQA